MVRKLDSDIKVKFKFKIGLVYAKLGWYNDLMEYKNHPKMVINLKTPTDHADVWIPHTLITVNIVALQHTLLRKEK